ncbi:hypothetical protein Vqi01_23980 [Micromonospora qiuiae]|uniref:Ricin B lectin domain-containing protein n=1 Tax=Micromonospora qiuiae TaxID=502268 RepID=A0ABQ4JAP7_9ACTN|nr:RICIN domain-containing protein [Micromonospora qiuiae]GIJ27236.1 hypothetical protein Vqi01_23980 [Micromonospora qiuiae]
MANARPVGQPRTTRPHFRAIRRAFAGLLALTMLLLAPAPAAARTAKDIDSVGTDQVSVASVSAIISYGANKFVSARHSQTDSPLQARANTEGSWEEFQFYNAGSGYYAIRSPSNGKFVSARLSQTDAPLQARSDVVSDWEKFIIRRHPAGYHYIQSVANGRYVTARVSQTDAPLQARASTVSDWEKFSIPYLPPL